MHDKQKAELLRRTGQYLIDIADVFDAGDPAEPDVPAAPDAPVDPAVNLPKYAQKRAKYLLAYVQSGGELSLAQVTAAAKKAGLGNPGSATSHGYVGKAGPGTRAITEKGLKWLKDNGYDVAIA